MRSATGCLLLLLLVLLLLLLLPVLLSCSCKKVQIKNSMYICMWVCLCCVCVCVGYSPRSLAFVVALLSRPHQRIGLTAPTLQLSRSRLALLLEKGGRERARDGESEWARQACALGPNCHWSERDGECRGKGTSYSIVICRCCCCCCCCCCYCCNLEIVLAVRCALIVVGIIANGRSIECQSTSRLSLAPPHHLPPLSPPSVCLLFACTERNEICWIYIYF